MFCRTAEQAEKVEPAILCTCVRASPNAAGLIEAENTSFSQLEESKQKKTAGGGYRPHLPALMRKLQQDPTALTKVKELLHFSSACVKKFFVCVFYVQLPLWFLAGHCVRSS